MNRITDFIKTPSKSRKNLTILPLIMLMTLFLSSCALMEGIFQAGIGIGIFIAIIVVALVIFLVSRFRRR
jgi:hypothetical protein